MELVERAQAVEGEVEEGKRADAPRLCSFLAYSDPTFNRPTPRSARWRTPGQPSPGPDPDPDQSAESNRHVHRLLPCFAACWPACELAVALEHTHALLGLLTPSLLRRTLLQERFLPRTFDSSTDHALQRSFSSTRRRVRTAVRSYDLQMLPPHACFCVAVAVPPFTQRFSHVFGVG